MQIPILNGVYCTEEYRTRYPRNVVPVPKQQGISAGYLRPQDGIDTLGTGPGTDRGAINWNGVCYRVMGTKLVRVNVGGSIDTLGDVGSGGRVRFDYSFDRLSIASGGRLYYYDGSALVQNTDADLGAVVDQMWVDGYFLTTDGVNLVVTDLNNPLSVNPLKYGSAEIDPDPIKAVMKVKNEPAAVGRYTVELFRNIGGDLFPFQRITGAQTQRGSIGTRTCALYLESLAFLGSGRNEAPAIWLMDNGATQKISDREIDQLLLTYTEAQLADCLMEVRLSKNENHLYLHLPDRTVVYDAAASAALERPVWFYLTSSAVGFSQYRAQNFVYCYNQWIVGDPQSSQLGVMNSTHMLHYGLQTEWDFGTSIIYNEGRGAIFHELQLSTLPGRVPLGALPIIFQSYSDDGVTFSVERAVSAGKQGETLKRIAWRRLGHMRERRIFQFRSSGNGYLSMARLEGQMEALNG